VKQRRPWITATINATTYARLAAVGLVCVVISLSPFGSIPDEDEKIAVGIFAANGIMPYRDILLNHGPLPYMLGSLGYFLANSIGSIFILRIIPCILAIATAFAVKKSKIFYSSLYASRAQTLWCLFLIIMWVKGGIRLGIYHGMGGLLACLILLNVAFPLINKKQLSTWSLWEFAGLSSLLASLSATFIPFILFTSLACLVGTLRQKPTIFNEANTSIPSRQTRPRRRLQALAIAAAFSPLITLTILMGSAIITAKSIYLGHIYFNVNIFGSLSPPPPFIPDAFDIQTQSLPFILIIGILVVPLLINYYVDRSRSAITIFQRKSGLMGTVAANTSICLLISLSILSLSYRTGPLAINDFHSLPYLIPASALIIVGCLRIAEARGVAKTASQTQPDSIADFILMLLASLPILIMGIYRLTSPTTIDIGSSIHQAITRYFGQYSNSTKLLLKLISAIESKENNQAKIFAWPYWPDFYITTNRPTSYPVYSYLWYNNLLEKDAKLSKYNICKREDLKKPAIIAYSQWKINEYNSDIYGKCLIRLQNESYFKLLSFIYVRKDYKELALKTLRDWPNKNDLVTPSSARDTQERNDAIYIQIPTNKKTLLRIKTLKPPSGDELLIQLGTYVRKNKGQLIFCVQNFSYRSKLCSRPIQKSKITNNSITSIAINGLSSMADGNRLILSIEDKTPISTSGRGDEIAIMAINSKSNDKPQAPILATWDYQH